LLVLLPLLQNVTLQVGADKAIKIANFLCPGNYAVSGSIEGCEAVERLGKDPKFKARMTVSGSH
jgi:[acyl-carrier-protein] S-malonyltransferase